MKILNFGSLNIDYVFKVARAVEPGQSIAVESPALFAGGKGLNQSVAAARAGGRVFHAGKIGPEGRFLLDTLTEAGADVSLVAVDEGLRCGGAYIQVEPNGRNTMLIAGGANRHLTLPEAEAALALFEPGDVVMLQNEINLSREIAELAVKRGLRVVYNPSPITEEVFAMPFKSLDLLIVNEDEGRALTGLTEPHAILEALKKRCGGTVVVTLGRAGSIGSAGGAAVAQPAYKVAAVDTTGAGDTFTGYLVAALYSGAGLAAAMERAARASALAVTRAGAAQSIPTADEVERFKA